MPIIISEPLEKRATFPVTDFFVEILDSNITACTASSQGGGLTHPPLPAQGHCEQHGDKFEQSSVRKAEASSSSATQRLVTSVL